MTSFAQAESKILSGLDLRVEFEKLGVKFTSGQPNSGGWLECRARLRDGDANASAAACVTGDNGTLGRYRDLGSDDSYSLWQFATAVGQFPDWRAARRFFADEAGVSLPADGGKRSKAVGHKDGAANAAKRNRLFDKIVVADEKVSQKHIEQWVAAKPPIDTKSVKAANARAVIFPKKASKKQRHLCVAFVGKRELDGPVSAVLLYRIDGKVFPKLGKLPERRSHLLGGSRDS